MVDLFFPTLSLNLSCVNPGFHLIKRLIGKGNFNWIQILALNIFNQSHF